VCPSGVTSPPSFSFLTIGRKSAPSSKSMPPVQTYSAGRRRSSGPRRHPPSGGVRDSQSVRTPLVARCGCDAGKKVVGHKLHIAVRTDGRLLMVNIREFTSLWPPSARRGRTRRNRSTVNAHSASVIVVSTVGTVKTPPHSGPPITNVRIPPRQFGAIRPRKPGLCFGEHLYPSNVSGRHE
jgi:hypothetical protein